MKKIQKCYKSVDFLFLVRKNVMWILLYGIILLPFRQVDIDSIQRRAFPPDVPCH